MRVVVETDDEGVRRLRFPEPYNAAEQFIDRHITEGRGNKVAIRTLQREVTYAELAENVNRFGNALTSLGIRPGDRILMVVKDCPDFFFLFWGAVKAGLIPIPLNGLAPASDFEFIIQHSKCSALFYSKEFEVTIETALAACSPKPKVIRSVDGDRGSFTDLARSTSVQLDAAFTRAEDDCFCLYSSGTTGLPKGVVHAHGDLAVISQFYTVETLGASEDDSFFNVARLCFSYGMNVGMLGSLYVGGTATLDDRRPTPQGVIEVFRRCQPMGVSRNIGMVKALEEKLGLGVNVCGDSHFIGAIGAAIFALERALGGEASAGSGQVGHALTSASSQPSATR